MGLRRGRSSFGAFIRSPFGAFGNKSTRLFIMTETAGTPNTTHIYELDPDSYDVINDGVGPNSSASASTFNGFTQVDLGGNGDDLYFLDVGAHTIVVLDADDFSVIDSFAAPDAGTTWSRGGAIGGTKDDLYLIQLGASTKLYKLDSSDMSILLQTSTFSPLISATSSSGLGGDSDRILNSNGTSSANNGLRIFSPTDLSSVSQNNPSNHPFSLDGNSDKIRIIKNSITTPFGTQDYTIYELDGTDFTLIDSFPLTGVSGALRSICGGK